MAWLCKHKKIGTKLSVFREWGKSFLQYKSKKNSKMRWNYTVEHTYAGKHWCVTQHQDNRSDVAHGQSCRSIIRLSAQSAARWDGNGWCDLCPGTSRHAYTPFLKSVKHILEKRTWPTFTTWIMHYTSWKREREREEKNYINLLFLLISSTVHLFPGGGAVYESGSRVCCTVMS